MQFIVAIGYIYMRIRSFIIRSIILILIGGLFLTSALLYTSSSAASDPSPLNSTPTSTPSEPSPLIVGGGEAGLAEYPWMAALYDPSIGSLFGFFCGSVLIHPEWVLTAAHCVHDFFSGTLLDPSDVNILLGVNTLGSSGGQQISANQIIPHPDFAQAEENDIALIHLAQSATLMSSVQPIPIVSLEESALIAPSTIATVTGWGETDDFFFSVDLMEVSIPIVSNTDCQTAFNDVGVTITEEMLCAGEDGKDACFGDSGGPLIVPNFQINGFRLAGIVSSGHPDGCGAPGKYGVYTRVPFFYQWIQSYIAPEIGEIQAYLPIIVKP